MSNTKNLYVLVSNAGDGSCYPQYTFDEKFIQKMDDAYNNGQLDYESMGCDGDGFHYDTIKVPVECTYESLGIRNCAYDIKGSEDPIKIVFVIDESGSMGPLQTDVIGGFNHLIEDQYDVEGTAEVTLITFSNTVKTILDNVDLYDVEDLNTSSYKPSGGTAMNDAIGFALTKVLREAPEKAIINIFTDGYENVSRDFTAAQVKELVKEAEERGYQVVFLAANIDEVAVAQTFGLAAGATRGFTADAKGMEFAYLNASAATTAYRNGGL